ncbi:unnamed protein product [Schistosoma margrebowiei]|uniref:Uncharacterized protein n=1 Tax=Schistosoma margrebowiei TaxID=48269 RepID=A0A183MR61_9TREM|nr:unnamed protein product [Schistosoma margrebowiei]
MREGISQRIFDDGLLRQLFLSKLPQQVKTVLVPFQNNAIDELATSADRIKKTFRTFNANVSSVKKKRQTTREDVMELSRTLTRYLRICLHRKR